MFKKYGILLFLLMTLFSPALFAQISPSGFLGCYGDDPNKWAEDAGPGECVASSGHILVAHGVYADVNDPSCAVGLDLFLGALANVFSSAVNYGFRDSLGPAAPIAESKLGNQFREHLEGRIDSRASCQIVSVKLPLGATNVRTTHASWWDNHYEQQAPLRPTAHGSRWEWPIITYTSSGPVVFAVFHNWSRDTDQWAVLRVIYKPANFEREKQRRHGSLE
jgi:hypothetical protein